MLGQTPGVCCQLFPCTAHRAMRMVKKLEPGLTEEVRFCRKISFEVIWGMLSPHDSW